MKQFIADHKKPVAFGAALLAIVGIGVAAAIKRGSASKDTIDA